MFDDKQDDITELIMNSFVYLIFVVSVGFSLFSLLDK